MTPLNPDLGEFPLLWRFTDAEKYTQLSADEFKRFSPLTEGESLQWWEDYVYPASAPGKRHLVALSVHGKITLPSSASFYSRSDEEETHVVANLQDAVKAEDSDEVLFFWHAEVSVRTDWGLLLSHWDDFCYPSDDSNIAILPGKEKAVAHIEERWYVLERGKGSTVFPLS